MHDSLLIDSLLISDGVAEFAFLCLCAVRLSIAILSRGVSAVVPLCFRLWPRALFLQLFLWSFAVLLFAICDVDSI